MDTNGRDLSGKFAKGHPGFKRAGVPELQRTTRQKLWQFFSEKVDKLPEIFDKLSDNQKARLLLQTAEFFLPRQKEMTLEITDDLALQKVDLTKLSEAALQEVLSLPEL